MSHNNISQNVSQIKQSTNTDFDFFNEFDQKLEQMQQQNERSGGRTGTNIFKK